MATLSNLTFEELLDTRRAFTQSMAGSEFLEDAAQRAVSVLYDRFRGAVPLVRLYATVPFGELPSSNRDFVSQLLKSKGAGAADAKTLVLSLLGTRGDQTGWNDRRSSQGHVGIPLVDAAFVHGIPMVANLLEQLGLALKSDDGRIHGFAEKSTLFSGVFHVPDARSAADDLGRKVIPAQDFVAAQGIKSVFGCGALYPLSSVMMALILFTRESLPRSSADAFGPLASSFSSETMRLVQSRKFFRVS